ncbi:MAG: peptidoglycan-binding protein [Aureispira sp.]
MHYFFLLLMLSFLTSCNLIFEDDLTKRKVELLSPPNNYTTYTQTQTFVWDSLPDVAQYRFQLVSKRFDFIEEYLLDTLLTQQKITLGLTPKEYEWRVIGLNSSSETDYTIYSLMVVQDTSLANQIVNIIAPSPNTIYEKDSVAFLWTSLGLANQYQLQVATNPSFNSQTMVVDTLTPQDFVYVIQDLGLGTFYYRIRAMRVGIDTTGFTAIQQFRIDRTPTLRTPVNNSLVTLPANMNWQRASNVAKDSLFLYHNNTATPYQKLELTSGNYTFSTTDTIGYGAGIYYWQVKSVGTNGIQSNFSNLWQFTIN